MAWSRTLINHMNPVTQRTNAFSTLSLTSPPLQNLVKEFITKDYQASVGMVIDRALRGDETANYEFPLMTKEGAVSRSC